MDWRLRDALGFLLVPFLAVTLLFLLLLSIRDPSVVAGSWPLAPLAGTFIATLGYVAHLIGRRMRRVEPWRDVL